MALWGNRDSKTASGTVAIASNGTVTGTSTSFTTQAKIGNYIRVAGEDYQIVSITSNTVAKVIAGKNGATLTAVDPAAAYTLSEKPAFVSHESADGGFGASGDASKVFGVDVTEVKAGGDNVAQVSVAVAGTGYLETPSVTFTGGDGSSAAATATISGGAVTAITVTNTGTGYTSAPTVNVDVPRRTVLTSAVDTTAETITYATHGLETGDRVTYYKVGSGTAIGGLTDATTYYVVKINANTFKLATSAENALVPTTINLTGTGNDAQYFDCVDKTTATARASLGDGAVGGAAHSGWVRRTVGTGGRAGRVFYETLVANGTTAATSGDQADDIQFRDS